MKRIQSLSCLSLCALAFTANALTSPDPTPRAIVDGHDISAAAEQAVRAAAGGNSTTLIVQDAPLDPRLRLAACDHPLQAFIAGDGQLREQNAVGVRCDGRVRWTIYTSVTVESNITVLIAKHPLPESTELTADDFSAQQRQVPGLAANYVTDAAALAGQRLRHNLSVGQPLTVEALAPDVLIHRGQQVVLLAKSSGFEVRMAGLALGDGGAEQRIRVENLSSQRIVEGIVRSDHLVETPF